MRNVLAVIVWTGLGACGMAQDPNHLHQDPPPGFFDNPTPPAAPSPSESLKPISGPVEQVLDAPMGLTGLKGYLVLNRVNQADQIVLIIQKDAGLVDGDYFFGPSHDGGASHANVLCYPIGIYNYIDTAGAKCTVRTYSPDAAIAKAIRDSANH